jgi:hypothetical protein
LFEDLQKKVSDAYQYGQNSPGSQSPKLLFEGVNIEAVGNTPTIFPTFRHEDAADYDLKSLNWLFAGVLPAAGTTVLVGPSQGGKTFLLIEAARSLATGKPFFGINPDDLGGTVIIYTGTEGSGFPLRLKALEEMKPLPITAITTSNLAARGALEKLAEFLQTESARMQERFGMPLRMVILETLSASGLMTKEDDNAQGAMAMANLATLARSLGVQVVTSHHPPKTGDGSRGASAIPNNADTLIEIFREGTESLRRVQLTKSRNAEQRPLGAYTLIQVDLGRDAKGRPVTSMAVSLGEPVKVHLRTPQSLDRFQQALDFVQEGPKGIPEHKVMEEFEDLLDGQVHRTTIGRNYKKCADYMISLGGLERRVSEGVIYLIRKDFNSD